MAIGMDKREKTVLAIFCGWAHVITGQKPVKKKQIIELSKRYAMFYNYLEINEFNRRGSVIKWFDYNLEGGKNHAGWKSNVME